MKTKTYNEFMLEEGTTLSPRSQYLTELTIKAEGEVVLVKNKKQWRIMRNEDVLVVTK